MPLAGREVCLDAASNFRALRRKGVFRGTMDTALNFIPFVGGAKNVAEAVRGRDFFPDRPRRL